MTYKTLRKLFSLLPILAWIFLSNGVRAENIAVIVAGGKIAQSDFAKIADRFEQNGFRVLSSYRPKGAELRDITAVMSESEIFGAGQRVVVLLGEVARSRNEAFFVVNRSVGASSTTLYTQSIPFSAIFDFTAPAPADAAILIGSDLPQSASNASTLAMHVPQGTALIIGAHRDIVAFSANGLLETAQSLPDKIAKFDTLEIFGFAAPRLAFPVSDIALQVEASELRKEATLWEVVKSVGSFEAYKLYLDAYPDGRWNPAAQSQFNLLQERETREAAEAEGALSLSVDQRQQIQRTLRQLQLQTNGLDGIFGPVTRRSIAEWQRSSGFRATGYLNADQYLALVALRLNTSSSNEADELDTTALELDDTDFSNNSLAFVRRVRLVEEIALGLTVDQIEAVERELLHKGFLNSTPDGVFDIRSRVALKEFQLANDLEGTGFLNQETMELFARQTGSQVTEPD